MKTRYIYFLLLGMIVVGGITSCRDRFKEDGKDGEEGMKVISVAYDFSTPEPDVKTRAWDVNGLGIQLFIFGRTEEEQDYTFLRNITLKGDGKDSLLFSKWELETTNYRFLFTATPKATPEFKVSGLNNQELTSGTVWEDIRINGLATKMSPDNYYGIASKNKLELLGENNNKIDGHLTRFVGQIVYDIYKVSTTINDSIPIADSTVKSVLDRVFKIEIQYDSLTKSLGFNGLNVYPVDKWEDSYVQEIVPSFVNDYQVQLPQGTNNLLVAGVGTEGSARILGNSGMPAPSRIISKLTFHYYDTTPVGVGGDFEQKKLELDLPAGNSGGLKILGNFYTLNKIGIKFDRIIDLGHSSDFNIDFDWNISE